MQQLIKLKVIVCLLSLISMLHKPGAAQVLISEDFQQGIPGNWSLNENDGLTPDSTVDFVTDAWVAYPDAINNLDTVALSTSKYAPPGAADDWLITPQLSLLGSSILTFNARAFDALNADGYEVRISTGTTAIADFLSNSAL